MATVRAKFRLQRVEEFADGAGKNLVFSAVSGPTNKTWNKWTPSGELKMQINNPEALNRFELGKYYFLDFSGGAGEGGGRDSGVAAEPEPARVDAGIIDNLLRDALPAMGVTEGEFIARAKFGAAREQAGYLRGLREASDLAEKEVQRLLAIYDAARLAGNQDRWEWSGHQATGASCAQEAIEDAIEKAATLAQADGSKLGS